MKAKEQFEGDNNVIIYFDNGLRLGLTIQDIKKFQSSLNDKQNFLEIINKDLMPINSINKNKINFVIYRENKND